MVLVNHRIWKGLAMVRQYYNNSYMDLQDLQDYLI
jgi:hypothetical protein